VKNIEYSVILPAYNEQDNILPLHQELTAVMQSLGRPYEIIFIDDGSRDKTFERLYQLSKLDGRVCVIKFRKNFGKTAAMDAGIKQSKGKVIITLDADLQNDPKDIPRLLARMQEGYDVVSGWRVNRKDKLSKKVVSLIANNFRRWLTREKIHDVNCMLKVYRKECFKDFAFYGDVHRYIPTILALKGFKIGEIPVNHRPRFSGKTKYGFSRIFKGFFDLLFIKFWNDFSTRPIHFFGAVAIVQFLLAGILLVEQFVKADLVGELKFGPVLMLSVLLIITGFLTFILGFLAEMMTRLYHREKPYYEIEAVF
jgi:glycosyltransferase involved in cell wall biosynthesis